MNDINIHIKEEALEHSSDPSYQPATPPLTPKRDEKTQHQQGNLAPTLAAISPRTPRVNKTPRKVGRPKNTPNKKHKASPYASPVSKSKQFGGMPPANMIPNPQMPPPSPINDFRNRYDHEIIQP
jgi:hypothetical protein